MIEIGLAITLLGVIASTIVWGVRLEGTVKTQRAELEGNLNTHIAEDNQIHTSVREALLRLEKEAQEFRGEMREFRRETREGLERLREA